MLDIEESCEILGLKKGASRYEIERRYAIILKKYRAQSSQDEANGAEQVDIQKITRAYNLLMGYEELQPVEDGKKPNPLLKKMGIDEKKAGNFLYYYKYHIIIGIIALIVLVFTVRSFVTKVNPDFTTAFIGQINYTDTELLKQQIKTAVPDIKEPGFDGAFISPGEAGSQMDIGMQTKAMVLFAAGNIDLYILDKDNFKKYAEQGAFRSLDDLAAKQGVDKEKNKDYILKTVDGTKEHLYGIDISGSMVLKNTGIEGTQMIVALPVNGSQSEKAIRVAELLLKQTGN